MALGVQLNDNFRSMAASYILTKEPIREIKLFDILISSFCNLNGYKVGRIHGNKYQVTYSDTSGIFAKPPRCELGDICIIAYSTRKKKAKLVVMQNKVARIAPNALSRDGSQINANLVQYQLLKTRPGFKFAYGKLRGRASNMIRTDRYPSVCIYGNFFINGSGDVDMASITANQFRPKNTSPQLPFRAMHPVGTIFYPGTYENLTTRNSSGDFYAARSLIDFGDLLEDLYIGKPIDPIEKAYIEKELEDAFQADATRASNAFRAVMQEFQIMQLSGEDEIRLNDDLPLEGNYPAQEPYSPLNFCRTLLLLNVDCENSSDFLLGRENTMEDI